MIIDIRDPSVDPDHLYHDFILWLKYFYKCPPQMNSWDLKDKIAAWAKLPKTDETDKEIEALLYCWVKLEFLQPFGFKGAIKPYVYVFRKGLIHFQQ